jgi:hypothetical protein
MEMDFKNKDNYIKAVENASGIAKAYMRISSIKTALTIFLGIYTVIKIVQVFKK